MRFRTFKPQFAPAVRNRIKRTTIRPTPKRMPKVGDRESWRQWLGKPYFSKTEELAQVELTEVKVITINLKGIMLADIVLEDAQQNDLAKADCFTSFRDMLGWFNSQYGLPITGIFIQGEDL